MNAQGETAPVQRNDETAVLARALAALRLGLDLLQTEQFLTPEAAGHRQTVLAALGAACDQLCATALGHVAAGAERCGD